MSAIFFHHLGQVHGTMGSATPKPHRGILRRIYDAMIRSRQRRAERDIARMLGLTAGNLTDEIERRITEHLMRNGGFRH